ncbi:MAG: DUF503 domain-containing protein [Peptococcaceae bacterium]|nr:DUF503 domain-containing protein [Peptococcaceae bacterium]
MRIGILTVELFLGEAMSLKDKRKVLKSLVTRLRSRFNVSVGETGYQDTWQRSKLAVVTVSNEASHVDAVLSTVLKFIEMARGIEVTAVKTEIL